MIAEIKPSVLSGAVRAATSKSSMQRACAAALLHTGSSIIHNPGRSNDDLAAIDVIRKLGADVDDRGEQLMVHSRGVHPNSGEINCGESGLGIRMFTPIAALSDRPLLINGSGSLASRPMNFFDEIFPRLGIEVKSNNGKLPLQIKGPLHPASIEVDGSLSSQFLTGLLMAFAASGAENVTITVKNLTSKPYIDLTLQVMEHFGWKLINEHYEQFRFPSKAAASKKVEDPIEYTVEGDWSGAAFLLVAAAIAGPATVQGLNPQSTQADKSVLQALRQCGARVSVGHSSIDIGPASLRAFHFDATECPDLFPPLVALASYCEGKSSIAGAKRLTHKESNRALTLREEFGKMGIEVELQGDLMTIGGGKVKGANVHSHHDHRIAMACAVAALGASGSTIIEEAQAVNKSYPAFYTHLQKLGAQVLMDIKKPA